MRTSLLALAIPAVLALGCQKSTPAPAAAPSAAAVKPPEAPATPAPEAAKAEATTGATAGAIVAAPAADEAKAAPVAEAATTATADGAKDGDAPKAEGCGGCGGACGAAAAKVEGEESAPTACGGAAGAAGEAAPTACAGVPGAVAAPEGAAPAAPATAHFGEAFTLTDSVPVDDVMTRPDEFNGKTVRVAANITKVCKKKGCWFVMAGDKADGAYIRVTMKDYGFFVPVDADGRKAVVEGVFKKVDVPEAARKHLAEDGKEDPTKVQGSAVELTLVATAIDITTP
jgi:hypothetical protein